MILLQMYLQGVVRKIDDQNQLVNLMNTKVALSMSQDILIFTLLTQSFLALLLATHPQAEGRKYMMRDHEKLGTYGGYDGFNIKSMCKKKPPRFHFTPGKIYNVYRIDENLGLHPPLDVLDMEMSFRELKDDRGRPVEMKKEDFIKYFKEKI
jgi:hypothetical protein